LLVFDLLIVFLVSTDLDRFDVAAVLGFLTGTGDLLGDAEAVSFEGLVFSVENENPSAFYSSTFPLTDEASYLPVEP
jgi:hypothetical protein